MAGSDTLMLTNNPLICKVFLTSDKFQRYNIKKIDARLKSLKPRCAYTGVILRLSDPPKNEDKSGAHASRYPNLGQDCGSTKYETIRMASFDPNIKKSVYDQSRQQNDLQKSV